MTDRTRRGGVLTRLYTGTGAFDIVGRRKLWYLVFGSPAMSGLGAVARLGAERKKLATAGAGKGA